MRRQGYRKLHRNNIAADTSKAKNARKKWLRNIITTLACLVVFVTTYALILPAITMDENAAAVCGLVDHTHSWQCYSEDGSLVCPLPEHEHDMGCFTTRSPLPSYYCGFTYEHVHNEDCYEDGALVCTLAEHKHSIYTGCYNLNIFDHVVFGEATDGTIVSVSGPIPEDAYVSVTPLTYSYDEVYAICGDDFCGSYAAYDICLMVKDEEYQPDAAVTVNVMKPSSVVPFGDGETLGVMHIADDYTCQQMVCVNEPEKLSFKTESFSSFILYSINFTGNDRIYTLEAGEDPAKISSILTALNYGTFSDSDIASAEVDVSSYTGAVLDEIQNALRVFNDNGVWKVEALEPFYTREDIIVTLTNNNVIHLAATGIPTKPDKPELKVEKVNNVAVTPAEGVDSSKTGVFSNSLLRMDYASDHSTSDIQKRDFYVDTTISSAANNGKTSTDKTVIYGDNEYYKGFTYGDGDFSVTLSALGQQYENSESRPDEVPVDVVFILDVSGSMDNGNPIRRVLLTDALNDLIDGIMDLNDGNRVGIVTFGSSSSYTTTNSSYGYQNDVQEFLPLGRYYLGANNATPDYSSSANNNYITTGTQNTTVGGQARNNIGYLRTANNLRRYDYTDYHYSNGGTGGWSSNNASTAVAQKTINVLGGTFTQGGIQIGGEMFQNNNDTVWQSPVSQRKYTRTPVFILISDGAPTLLNENYQNPVGRGRTNADPSIAGGGSDGNITDYLGAAGYYTILTANYWKRQVTNHYGKQASFYTIGMGINATGYGNAVNSSYSGDHYKRTVLNPTAENVNDLVSSGSRGQSRYQYFSGVMHALLNNSNSITGSTATFVNNGNINVGNNQLTGDSSVARVMNPYAGDYSYADASYSDATWADENGGQLDRLAHTITALIEANIKTYSYTTSVRTSSSSLKLVDTIGDGMEIKPDAGIVLRYNGENYTLTETATGSGVFHYVGNATVTPNFYVDPIALAGDVDVGEIEVKITSDMSGAQVVTWTIPSAFVPEYTHTTYGDWYYDELPIRLMYKVGLTAEAAADVATLQPGEILTYYTNNPDEYNAQSTIWPNTATGKENPYYSVAHNVTYDKTAVTGSSVPANPTDTVTTSFRSSNAAGDTAVYSYLGNNGKLSFSRTDAPTPPPAGESTQFTVTKVWQNPQGTVISAPPGVNSVRVQLIKTIESTNTSTVYATQNVTAANSWSYTWTNLPKTENSETIKWSAKEIAINGNADDLSFYTTTEGTVAEGQPYWQRVTSFTAGKTYYFVTASGTQRAISYSGTGDTLAETNVTGRNATDRVTANVPTSQQWVASATGTSAVLHPESNSGIAMRLRYNNNAYSFRVDNTANYNTLEIANADSSTGIVNLRFNRRANGQNNYRYINNNATPSPQNSTAGAGSFYIYEYQDEAGFSQTITNRMKTTRQVTITKTLDDSCTDTFTMDIGYYYEGADHSLGFIDLSKDESYTVTIPDGAIFKIRETNPGGYLPSYTVTGATGSTQNGVFVTGAVTGNASVNVHNGMAAELPMTGGSGTQWYTIAGIAVMVLAVLGAIAYAVYYIKRKKKQ